MRYPTKALIVDTIAIERETDDTFSLNRLKTIRTNLEKLNNMYKQHRSPFHDIISYRTKVYKKRPNMPTYTDNLRELSENLLQ